MVTFARENMPKICIGCVPDFYHIFLPLQRCIFNCAKFLVEICAVKMDQDWFVLYDMLVLVFNPLNKLVCF